MAENRHTREELAQMQSLPLDVKIRMTEYRIREWIKEFGTDGVYVSFSGGKDSTVLLDIVRNRLGYDDIPAVFVDTGLEYPEIRDFVKSFDNVVWLKPEMQFKKVIEEYGYPFISKEVSGTIGETRKWLDKNNITWSDLLTYRQTDRQTDSIPYYRVADLIGLDRRGSAKESKEYQLLKKGVIPKIPIRAQFLMGVGENPHTGEKSPFNKEKWAFAVDAPFLISNQCCAVMKKKPMKKYCKEFGRHPMTAQMASESRMRMQKWIQHGCNMFDAKHPISNPMSFWTENDVLLYIKKYNIPICSVYGDIVYTDDDGMEYDDPLFIDDMKLKTTGCNRTGCMFCGYGCHLEKEGEGRFERMKVTHPKQYEWIMKPWSEGGLGYKEVIDWLNENGGLNIRY